MSIYQIRRSSRCSLHIKSQSCSGHWRLHSEQTTSPWSQASEQLPVTWGGASVWQHVDLAVLRISSTEALSSAEPVVRPRCPPCVPANLYQLHCIFGCIFEIYQISDDLRKLTMVALEYANLQNFPWQASTVLWQKLQGFHKSIVLSLINVSYELSLVE